MTCNDRTDRLSLTVPTPADVDPIYAICSDPRVWRHYRSLRHTDRQQSADLVDRMISGWQTNGLDAWIVRARDTDEVIGYAGCSILHRIAWNLGYRMAYRAHGHGYATEASRYAIQRANELRPELAVIAYLLEHNVASARVAEKVGLSLVSRVPDAGNPDPFAVRLIFADRELAGEELAAAQR